MSDVKSTGEELKKKFLLLLSQNSYDIWDKEDTLKNVEKLCLNEEELGKMEKGLAGFAPAHSETNKILFFKIKNDTSFLFFPYCSVQFQGAIMVSNLIEINP